MAKTNRITAGRAGTVAVEGLDVVILFTAAGLGGWVASYVTLLPSPWTGVLGGICGLAFAFGVMELLDSFMSSLRALTRLPSSPAVPAYGLNLQNKEDLPSDPEDLVDRLDQVARADAAAQAAQHSYHIDHARELLHVSDRWVGFEDDTALFLLIDGVYVQYRMKSENDFTRHEYAFVVPETGAEPITLKSMAHLRDLTQEHVQRESDEEPAFA